MTLKKDGKKSAKKMGKKGQKSAESSTFGEIQKQNTNVISGKETGNGIAGSGTSTKGLGTQQPYQSGNCESTSSTSSSTCKLDRKPSLRRKFGALIRGSADLPAAINRGLQPIRRSLSFSKDLNRVYETQPSAAHHHHIRTRSAQWYNSLCSLAENDPKDEDEDGTLSNNKKHNINNNNSNSSHSDGDDDDDEDDEDHGNLNRLSGRPIGRTHSLLEKNLATSPRRRVHTVSGKAAPYGRYSDHYDSTIDLSKPPFEAISLPVLTRSVIDEDETGSRNNCRREHRVWNGWGNLRTSARNLSLLRLGSSFSRERPNYSITSTFRGRSVESSQETTLLECDDEEVTTSSSSRRSVLRSLVRRLSSGGGGGGSIGTGSGSNSRTIFGCGVGARSWKTGLGTGDGGSCSTTVSAPGAWSGRAGTASRRASRELSPSKVPGSPGAIVVATPAVEDVAGSWDQRQQAGGGSLLSTTGSCGPPGTPAPVPQDWRRLVGSIRRKVRRKTPQGTGPRGSESGSNIGINTTTNNTSNLVNEISCPSLNETTCTKNQDDFLKATMRIFLVVSPPMGRVQVRSRSLTQLDALGTSMLDAGEHHLVAGGPSSHQTHQQQQQQQQLQLQQQQQHQQLQQQQQQQQLQQQQQAHHRYHSQHQAQQHYGTAYNQASECSPRLLVPSAGSADGSHPNRPRHKLSRSQVSSSEYFSVSFEVGDESGSLEREEFLPATKGTFLVEALGGACERRGVDLGRVDVLLDAFSTPLPILTTETSCLGGKHLRVTPKDEKIASRSASQKSNQNVSLRKTSGSYRGRSGRFFSVSTEDSSVDSEIGTTTAFATAKSTAGAAGLKASKQRWSGFFTNTKGTKMELLVEQLNGYTKHGVPRLPEIQLPYDLAANEEALYGLEEDWRDIVDNSDRLPEKQQQQQTALWELAQTEVAYIRTLKVVTDLFMACLCSLQASNILNEVDRTRLFSNIPDIYAANRFFWSEHVLGMINAARSTGNPLDPGHLLHGFETFEQTFAPYTRYCSEQSKCQQYCRDRLNDNELFTAYLVWCETQKDCNRLRLLDILVKPMQRLTKYSLLLKAVHKNTENEEQRAELTMMIKFVDCFVASVNAALRRTEETARLAGAASRIESYDVVESRDEELEKLVKFHSNFDITSAPMPGCPKDTLRTLVREGDLKLRDAATSKTEVHVLLLTDMLLLCKPSTKKASTSSGSGGVGGGLKIIRQPYVVDRIRIHELKEPSSLGLVYLNEYGAASAALVLTAGEPKLAKSWMESLRKAQQQFAIMKLPPLGGVPAVGTMSRQASTYLGDGDYEMEECDVMPRTPRGSSRASRVSSLAHSHSGSMEMEGVSPGSSSFVPSYNPSRNVSVETTEPPRASSVSSEEGGEVAAGHNHRALQIRRSLLSKSPTPNTLSVQVPAYSSLGQSLPNLTLATSPQTSTVSPTPPNSLLIVPQITKSKDTLLSPGHRGISYPPPSPPRGALRRAFAIPQSRNPPLIKTRHVNASVTQTAIQATLSLDTEAIEERRKRLELSQRVPSIGSIAKEEKRSEENR